LLSIDRVDAAGQLRMVPIPAPLADVAVHVVPSPLAKAPLVD
jgi:hypothetical protein